MQQRFTPRGLHETSFSIWLPIPKQPCFVYASETKYSCIFPFGCSVTISALLIEHAQNDEKRGGGISKSPEKKKTEKPVSL